MVYRAPEGHDDVDTRRRIVKHRSGWVCGQTQGEFCSGIPPTPCIDVEHIVAPKALTTYAGRGNLEMKQLNVEQAFVQLPPEEIYAGIAEGCGESRADVTMEI